MADDLALLSTYGRTRDADAFAQLVGAHAGLVYGTCLRILHNPHDAEEVTQECFLELARKCGDISSSLPGWLHALATSRARDAIRRARVRREREQEAAWLATAGTEPDWEQLAPRVDEVLETLPEELRLPLVLHYLQGRGQADIAQQLGVSQPTVSRRLEAGVQELRLRLSAGGPGVSLKRLSGALAASALNVPLPASLQAALGKMALAGVGKAVGTGLAAAAPAAGTTVTPLVLGLAVGAVILAGAWYVVRTGAGVPANAGAALPVAAPTGAVAPTAAARVPAVAAAPVAVKVISAPGGRLTLEAFSCRGDYQTRGFGELLALQDCLQFRGCKVSWPDLLGYSGDAFSCDSVSHPAVRARDVLRAAALAFGFTGQWVSGTPDTVSRELYRAVAGRDPVLVGTAETAPGSPVVAVVMGADPPRHQLLLAGVGRQPCWLPDAAAVGFAPARYQVPALVDNAAPADSLCFRLGPPRPPAEPAVRLHVVLRQAVDAYRSPAVGLAAGPVATDCPLGRDCLVAWPGRLRQWAADVSIKPLAADSAGTSCPGYFAAVALAARRRAAAVFLRQHAEEWPEAGARAELLRAAGHYAESAQLADRLYACLYETPEIAALDWVARLKLEASPHASGSGARPPAAWAAVIRRANATFADARAVDAACELADSILRRDDAAMAAVEAALTARR